MSFIKDFCQVESNEISLVGGKGASLATMTQAGFPVPPGFIVLTTAFEYFIRENKLDIAIKSILQFLDYKKTHVIESAAAKIQAMIMCEEMPQKIKNEIMHYCSALDSRNMAVRSSATVEDSEQLNWAGQFESYINTPHDKLFHNIQRCWASLFSPRAIFYRFKNNLQKKKISMAVIVQKMIHSQVSGTAFSMNPLTNNTNCIMIESVFGLGEALASGYITPDSYLVHKSNFSLIKKEIYTQEKTIIQSPSGGNEWCQLPIEKGQCQKLPDNDIVRLSKIIRAIEKLYPIPINIEWAKEKEHFYLLQSRPITSNIPGRDHNKKTESGLFSYGTYTANLLANNATYHRPQTFNGIPVSRGITKGKVRLILYKDEIHKLQTGEILVTEIATPELISAIHKAAAIITDEGGQESHLAIFLSREMQKPCIIGTKIATKFLQNGDLIEVNGDKGSVSILEHQHTILGNTEQDLKLFDL